MEEAKASNGSCLVSQYTQLTTTELQSFCHASIPVRLQASELVYFVIKVSAPWMIKLCVPFVSSRTPFIAAIRLHLHLYGGGLHTNYLSV